MNIPNTLNNLMRILIRNGIDCYVAGGAVRDHIMGRVPNDFDVVAVGTDAQSIQNLVGGNLISQSSGKMIVEVHVDGQVYQFSVVDSLSEDARSRDFTMNAMFYDIVENRVIDLVGGIGHIDNGVIHHVSNRFVNDPLRILRAARFVSVFGFSVHAETLRYFRSINRQFVSDFNNPNNGSRVYAEYSRILVGRFVRNAFLMLQDANALPREISDLVGCQQSPVYHPEGDVFNHTLHTLQYAATRMMGREDALVICLTMLLHDIGKPATVDANLHAFGHEDVGAEMAADFMSRYGFPNEIANRVLPLIRCHMRRDLNTPSAVRRLSVDVAPESLDNLAIVMECDSSGRPPLPSGMPLDVSNMLQIARDLNVSSNQPQPILQGRHLISVFQMSPSPRFGEVLSAAFRAQLDGQFDTLEGALSFVVDAGLV